MSSKLSSVVCDAGPIIHLDQLDCMDLLNDFSETLVPKDVWQEVLNHRPQLYENRISFLKIIEPRTPPTPALSSLMTSLTLDRGEQAALTLMQDYPNAIFLTDDAAARLAAVSIGHKVHGTLGILVRSIRRNQMTKSEVLTILRKLPEKSTLYVKMSLLNKVIQQVEES